MLTAEGLAVSGMHPTASASEATIHLVLSDLHITSPSQPERQLESPILLYCYRSFSNTVPELVASSKHLSLPYRITSDASQKQTRFRAITCSSPAKRWTQTIALFSTRCPHQERFTETLINARIPQSCFKSGCHTTFGYRAREG